MDVLTKQLQIAELAAARPEESFTSLKHYLDMDWRKEAYRRTRRESAAGVDGKTMEQDGNDGSTRKFSGQHCAEIKNQGFDRHAK